VDIRQKVESSIVIIAVLVNTVLVYKTARQIVVRSFRTSGKVDVMLLIKRSVADQDLWPIIIGVPISSSRPDVVYRIVRIVFIRKSPVHKSTNPFYLFVTVYRCQPRIGIGLVICRCPGQGIYKARNAYRRIHGEIIIVFNAHLPLLTFFGGDENYSKRCS